MYKSGGLPGPPGIALAAEMAPVPKMAVAAAGPPAPVAAAARVRTEFPETWLWLEAEAG